MRFHHTAMTAVCATAVLGLAGLAPASADEQRPKSAAAAKTSADFNGDGYADLAISARTARYGELTHAGAVAIVYGSAEGFRYDRATVLDQADPGIPGDPRQDARWGEIAGHGDMDGDGFTDLIVRDSGYWTVLWGGADGVSGGARLPAGGYTPESPILYNIAASTGDINGDGITDLVAPSYISTGSPTRTDLGVSVFRGPISRDGKPAALTFENTTEDYGHGVSVAAVGDMTGDGIDDVVGHAAPGTSFLLKGTREGRLVDGGRLFGGVAGAIGDLDGDGYGDFVGGDARELYGTKEGGLITVTYGGPDGVSATRPSAEYNQASPGIPGIAEKHDHWGQAIEVADADRDGFADILVGAPWETATDPVATKKSGAVTVLRGSASGMTTAGSGVISQNSKSVPSSSEPLDYFGTALRVVDGDRDGNPEVYIGGEGEDLYKGRVWKLPAGTGGITAVGSTSFNLTDLGGPARGTHFGGDLTG
jgi:hypothetical protein